MTRLDELRIIMESVISGQYSRDQFNLFSAEYGWEDWMNKYTEAGEDEELSEEESEEIDAILKEGFKMAFDDDYRKVWLGPSGNMKKFWITQGRERDLIRFSEKSDQKDAKEYTYEEARQRLIAKAPSYEEENVCNFLKAVMKHPFNDWTVF